MMYCDFQAAMIGMGGTAIAQAITWATKTLTAAIVKEVANVPPPSRYSNMYIGFVIQFLIVNFMTEKRTNQF